MIRPMHIALASLALVAGAAGAQVSATAPAQPSAVTSVQPADTPGMRASGTASSTGYDRSVRDLMRASDALRDAIHAMAREQPGERRNEAIRAADRALMQAQAAMATAYDSSASLPHTRTLGGPGAHCVRLGDMLGCR